MVLPAFCKVLPRTNNLIVPGWTSIFQKWVPWEFNTFNHKINTQILPSTNVENASYQVPSWRIPNVCQHIKGPEKSCI